MVDYNFNQHRHNFAIWTAASAVRRAFTNNGNIKDVIENSDLRAFAEDSLKYAQVDFDKFHDVTALKMIDSFHELGITNATYGRVSKIISIYLKTSIVLCNKGECDKSEVIHPPIDSILLKRIGSGFQELKSLKNQTWTAFNKDEYWKVVSQIRNQFSTFNWTLEEYWEV
jgi:hypothetical protein